MQTQNNRTAMEDAGHSGYGREILMPEDFVPVNPDMERPGISESSQREKDSEIPDITTDTSDVEKSQETSISPSDFDAEEWDIFMSELKSYDPTKRSRDERLVCRIDRDLSESIDDIEIFGYSRPDIVSAIVRTFFKRHLSRLMEMRRIKKSIFPPLNSVCQ